jgi:hypothetical protein
MHHYSVDHTKYYLQVLSKLMTCLIDMFRKLIVQLTIDSLSSQFDGSNCFNTINVAP